MPKVYLAHTHPLSNDDVCKFLNIKVDPREEMAFGYKALPLGNKPSSGDISFLSQFQKDFEDAGIEVSGVVFSATGLWEFSIVDILNFNSDKFVGAYDVVFPIEDSEDFLMNFQLEALSRAILWNCRSQKLGTIHTKHSLMGNETSLLLIIMRTSSQL